MINSQYLLLVGLYRVQISVTIRICGNLVAIRTKLFRIVSEQKFYVTGIDLNRNAIRFHKDLHLSMIQKQSLFFKFCLHFCTCIFYRYIQVPRTY